MPKLLQLDGKCVKENWESQRAAQRYNPATEFVFQYWNKEYRITLSCGDSDHIDLYRCGTDVYCVTMNQRLDYVGITRWTWDHGQFQESGDIFCQGQEHYEEYLGKNGLDDLSNRTIARRLIRILDEVCC